MASSLTSALSSMEVMLDALMQRGIGKPDDKPKEEEPPALPTRPTVRGRPPSVISRPGSPAPWLHRPPLPPIPQPPQEEQPDEEKCSINLELERRALKAEEEAKQKEEDVMQKEEEIVGLRQQIDHYESRLYEWEAKMRSVEEELQKQITALQMSQSAANRTGGSPSVHRRESSSGGVSVTRAQQPPATTVVEEASPSVKRHDQPVDVSATKQNHADNLSEEFARERQAFEHAVKAVAEVKPGTMSVDELKMLKRQFVAWRKEYAVRLRKAKAELRKRVHSEKSHEQQAGHGGGNARRRWCGWWRTIKAPKFRVPKRCCTCSIKFPSCSCFCCCFRRHR